MIHRLSRTFSQKIYYGGQRCLFSTKKDLSSPIAAAYNPKEVEKGWYEWWEQNGFFRRNNSQSNFIMVLPPPNVTGHLHLGHAMTCAIQDALARWHQMNGKRVIWVPGCDHAGIATQVVVERHLWTTQKITRHQLGKEKFISEVIKWKDQKGMKIYDQMKRLGVSLDWDRCFYTMDEAMSESVIEAFVRLFDSNLIYRKMSLVNWCCELQSTISNIEVENLELKGPTPLKVPGYEKSVMFGQTYDFAYKIEGSEEEIVVSTTRPETMLGDTAVMVHPDDARYKHLLGRRLSHPFRKDTIPLIADTSVNPEFGTGAVKVTPSHSPQDYEVGQRHNLQEISVIDERGKISISEFKDQRRFIARTSVIDSLKQLDLFRDCRPQPMVIPRCSRTGDIIEPLLKPQWYVSQKEMADKAFSAVQNGELKFHPEFIKKEWYNWLNNIQDWCISRQLWWGHRIPVYHIITDKGDFWIAASSIEQAKAKLMDKIELSESEIRSITQDNDVLDTWFSSGILPFAVFGWPKNTQDYSHLYPTSLLETGHDILFFWVARMVMLGLQLTDKLPFETVLLHGLINDAEGKKMSKSRGNIIDPMDVIDGAPLQVLLDQIIENEKKGILSKEDTKSALKHQAASSPKGIPTCGADALRFSLCLLNHEEQRLSVNIHRMELSKFLGNKIWQVMRFLLSSPIDDACCSLVQFENRDELNFMDRWILSHLARLVNISQEGFTSYNLHYLCGSFDKFWYNALCGVYLESIKPVLNSNDEHRKFAILQTLWTTVEVSLRLMAPFMPYLTEELYQRLPMSRRENISIMQCDYPLPNQWNCWIEPNLEDIVSRTLQVVSALRHLKTSYNILRKDLEGCIITEDKDLESFFNESSPVIKTLSRIGSLTVLAPPAKPPGSSAFTTISDSTSVYIQLEGFIDSKAETNRLEQKIAKLEKEKNHMLKQLAKKARTVFSKKRPL